AVNGVPEPHEGMLLLLGGVVMCSFIQGDQSCVAAAKLPGMPKQILASWLKQSYEGQLIGAGPKVASPEQIELTRLRTELARVKIERDILIKVKVYFARESV
ncbi:MAG: hypothetical protein ABIR84_11300, partial [Candidatus Nitrotoga sp.]